MEALTPNSTDRRVQHRATKKLKTRAILTAAYWQDLLKSYAGRFVLWDILTACGVHKSTFSQNGLEMAFKSGKQDLGHWLLIQIDTHDPAQSEAMHREARERERLEGEDNKAAEVDREKEQVMEDAE